MSDRQGMDRVSLIDAKSEQMLSRLLRTNRGATVVQIVDHFFNAGDENNVPRYTVCRIVLNMVLRSRKPLRVPMLTQVHCQQRLQRAHERRNWTLDE